MSVTVIGIGTMGRAVIERLSDCGVSTHVWNRSGTREVPPATRHEDLLVAIRAATSLVIFCVTDLTAVRTILGDVLKKSPGTITAPVVTLVSGTPDEGRATAAFLGRIAPALEYIDGAYCGPPTAVVTGTGMVFVSTGRPTLGVAAQRILGHLGAVHHAGPIGASRALNYAVTDHAFLAFLALYGNAATLRAEGVPMDVYFQCVARRLEGVPPYLTRLWNASANPGAPPTVSLGTYAHYFGAERRAYAATTGANTDVIDFCTTVLRQRGEAAANDDLSSLLSKL